MKKLFLSIASLLTMVSLMGVVQVGVAAASTGQSTTAPAALSTHTRQADLSKLGSKRLSAQQIRALGLRPASRQDVARIKQLQKNHLAKTSTVGTYYWYTWHNSGNSWVDRYYSGPYYSYPWYPYYVLYDNFKTCTYSGGSCIGAGAYTYQYYLYYYPQATWYVYNTGGYQSSSTYPYGGFGPYSG